MRLAGIRSSESSHLFQALDLLKNSANSCEGCLSQAAWEATCRGHTPFLAGKRLVSRGCLFLPQSAIRIFQALRIADSGVRICPLTRKRKEFRISDLFAIDPGNTNDAYRAQQGALLLRVPKCLQHNLENQSVDYYSKPQELERQPPMPLRPRRIDETNSRPPPCNRRAIFRNLSSAAGPRIGRNQSPTLQTWYKLLVPEFLRVLGVRYPLQVGF